MEVIIMKKFSVKSIVAIGIGAALFFVLGRIVAIPSPVPNTNISVQYGLLWPSWLWCTALWWAAWLA